ncbi:hypothetical protein SDC9_185463 [bioreactor metagenome]|uniref:Uncharacterized protein n=1 Tax=bioreactor metagenome TaxID=1076179 RepID=A0A645HHS3_9ZZZZ
MLALAVVLVAGVGEYEIEPELAFFAADAECELCHVVAGFALCVLGFLYADAVVSGRDGLKVSVGVVVFCVIVPVRHWLLSPFLLQSEGGLGCRIHV